MDIKNEWHKLLASAENKLAKTLGFGDILEYASKRPSELGLGHLKEVSPEYDTLRHLLLGARMIQEYPRLGPVLLQGHESLTGRLHGEDPAESYGDTINNTQGMELGRLYPSRDALELQALLALPKAVDTYNKREDIYDQGRVYWKRLVFGRKDDR